MIAIFMRDKILIYPDPCEAGSYRTESMLTCETCSVIQYSLPGSTVCHTCTLGQVPTSDRTTCGEIAPTTGFLIFMIRSYSRDSY